MVLSCTREPHVPLSSLFVERSLNDEYCAYSRLPVWGRASSQHRTVSQRLAAGRLVSFYERFIFQHDDKLTRCTGSETETARLQQPPLTSKTRWLGRLFCGCAGCRAAGTNNRYGRRRTRGGGGPPVSGWSGTPWPLKFGAVFCFPQAAAVRSSLLRRCQPPQEAQPPCRLFASPPLPPTPHFLRSARL